MMKIITTTTIAGFVALSLVACATNNQAATDQSTVSELGALINDANGDLVAADGDGSGDDNSAPTLGDTGKEVRIGGWGSGSGSTRLNGLTASSLALFD